ncbi:L-dopachrome tautomerase-related protein [Owenweeksia hongkongensis]|uniref:L-dopachrome tautomerase-related protein n=1 Tax=Owenweeksia hongkongensis TaxID=253245 RepID=UPI003A91803B
MKHIIILLAAAFTVACSSPKAEITQVAAIKGQQLTGIAVSNTGSIFVNFPRWRSGVKQSVARLNGDGEFTPYPNAQWNNWEIGEAASDSVFIGVQSVFAHQNNLYVLDTRNPQFQGVLDAPRIFVFDLNTDQLIKTYVLSPGSYHSNSYINDLRIDTQHNKMYLTDSERGGLVVVDLSSGQSFRVLDGHASTSAETDHLTINGKKWSNTVNSDGIALDVENGILYYHSLTGYSLYAVPTAVLSGGNAAEIENNVKLVATTPAPDGMIFESGNLYLADLEHHKIMRYNPASNKLEAIAESDQIKWADSFSIYKGELYFTNSRIHEVSDNIAAMEFSVNKISIQ